MRSSAYRCCFFFRSLSVRAQYGFFVRAMQRGNLKQVVKENQLMEAAIMKVDKARYELKLSLRKSDTQRNPDMVSTLPYLIC